MSNTSISKTLGPIHFEDLDPMRFEDLVRELVYDFRDWQTIEATGRAGSDDGFDIRAFERDSKGGVEDPGDDEEKPVELASEGRVWMFQCKREKDLGPKRVAAIIAENVDANAPPYGYVLAAPANFSKASFDKFRELLRARGVIEFQLWGRAALEDMLHQPKNDRILFTFFGISLVSRRRSRATEVRSAISAKNKLKKLFSNNPSGQPILFRDIKDSHYPYEDQYHDFEKVPRWREYPVVEMHPLGIIVTVREHFAFVDTEAKTWDYTDVVNLVSRQVDQKDQRAIRKKRERVEDFWSHLESASQVTLIIRGLVRFDEIVAIDPEGDIKHEFPHIFVDFKGRQGPFGGYYEFLERNGRVTLDLDDLKRIKLFPKDFSEPKLTNLRSDRQLDLPPRYRSMTEHMQNDVHLFYDCDGKYSDLRIDDVVRITGTSDYDKNELLGRITFRRVADAKDFLDEGGKRVDDKTSVQEHIGRELRPEDKVEIVEFRIVYPWKLERGSPD